MRRHHRRPISASAALTAAAACGTFIVIVFRKWRNAELRAGRAMADDAVDYRWPTLKTKAKIIFPALSSPVVARTATESRLIDARYSVGM